MPEMFLIFKNFLTLEPPDFANSGNRETTEFAELSWKNLFIKLKFEKIRFSHFFNISSTKGIYSFAKKKPNWFKK